MKDEVRNRLIIQVEYETDEDREAALEDLAFLLTNNLVLIGEAGDEKGNLRWRIRSDETKPHVYNWTI